MPDVILLFARCQNVRNIPPRSLIAEHRSIGGPASIDRSISLMQLCVGKLRAVSTRCRRGSVFYVDWYVREFSAVFAMLISASWRREIRDVEIIEVRIYLFVIW